ncbi:MAG: hypothetical protein KDK06_17985 [Gammaproteobacteria bacterium]|nr:hypothetical protein [Gammaproteobacteria bacterium]
MIWDRYDDAMDDIDDEQDELTDRIAALEARLRARGVDPGAWAMPDFRGHHQSFGGPHDSYLDASAALNAVRGRYATLGELARANGLMTDAEVAVDAEPAPDRSAAESTADPPAPPEPARAPLFGLPPQLETQYLLLLAVALLFGFFAGVLVMLLVGR